MDAYYLVLGKIARGGCGSHLSDSQLMDVFYKMSGMSLDLADTQIRVIDCLVESLLGSFNDEGFKGCVWELSCNYRDVAFCGHISVTQEPFGG